MGGYELNNLKKGVYNIDNMNGLRVPAKGASKIKIKLRHIDQINFLPKRFQVSWIELVREDSTYKWDELKVDIEKNGVTDPIYVCYCTLKNTEKEHLLSNCRFRIADGNHRLRVLQEILKQSDEVEVYLLSEDQCEVDAHERPGKVSSEGYPILGVEDTHIKIVGGRKYVYGKLKEPLNEQDPKYGPK